MPADSSAFTAHRRLLFDIAYRMLGRVAEAEDRLVRFGPGSFALLERTQFMRLPEAATRSQPPLSILIWV